MCVKCRINGVVLRTKGDLRCMACIPLLHGLGCRRGPLAAQCLEVKLVGFTPSFVRFVTREGALF